MLPIMTLVSQQILLNTRAGKRILGVCGSREVYIYSKQWKAFWRPNARGYTDKPEEAWVLTLAEALEYTNDCGPEKKIFYKFLD